MLKQLLYGLFYLAVFGVVIFIIYLIWFKPAPSCFNGVRDVGEEGVDCGEVCSGACVDPNSSQIQISELAQIFHPTATSISLMVQVQNPNSEIAAENFPYKFVLRDVQGNILHEVSGESFVYASEIKYIAEFNLQFPDISRITSADFVLGMPRWVSKTLFAKPEVSVQNFTTSESDSGIKVEGDFINNDTVPAKEVTILAVFYSNVGRPAGISKSQSGTVAPEQQQSFSVFHPALGNINFSGTKIYLYAK